MQLNNIAKVGVDAPFSLSPMTFFHKVWDWVALSLSLKRKKAQAAMGLKN